MKLWRILAFVSVAAAAFVACRTPPPPEHQPVMAMGVGPDQTGTGFNWGVGSVNQLANWNCPDANTPMQCWDAGYPACCTASQPVDAAAFIPQTTGAVIDTAGALTTLSCTTVQLYAGNGASTVPICRVLNTGDIVTPLTTAPPIGSVDASTISGTSETLDSGLLMGAGQNAHVKWDTNEVTLTTSGWVTAASYTPTVLNQGDEVKVRATCWDYSYDAGTGSTPVNLGNHVLLSYIFAYKVNGIDGGILVESPGGAGTWDASVTPLPGFEPSVTMNCTDPVTGAGCTGVSNNLITNTWALQAQAISSAGSVLFQLAYWQDSGTFPAPIRCGIDVIKDERTGTAP